MTDTQPSILAQVRADAIRDYESQLSMVRYDEIHAAGYAAGFADGCTSVFWSAWAQGALVAVALFGVSRWFT